MKNYLAKQLYQSSFYPLLFMLICWIIFLVQEKAGINLTFLGIQAREVKGLPGILTSVFIHGDITHIASNTIPILVLGLMVFYFYKKIAKPAVVWIWLVSGLWLWIGGRNPENHPTWHIGASTLIYGLATFLFFSGIFRRHLQLMVVSALVVFLYGGIMWGIFPLKQEISWEGHLFGAIAGMLVAFNYRREGPQRRRYEWEDEQEPESDESAVAEEEQSQELENGPFTVRYIYKSEQDPPKTG